MIPPDNEIYEVEKRIADRRHRVEAAARASGRQAMRALASPWALAGAAIIGFVAAGGTRPRHYYIERRRDSGTKKAAKASGVMSAVMAAATWFIKSQFGSPVAMAQYFLAKAKKQPPPLKVPAAAPMSSRADKRPEFVTRR